MKTHVITYILSNVIRALVPRVHFTLTLWNLNVLLKQPAEPGGSNHMLTGAHPGHMSVSPALFHVTETVPGRGKTQPVNTCEHVHPC